MHFNMPLEFILTSIDRVGLCVMSLYFSVSMCRDPVIFVRNLRSPSTHVILMRPVSPAALSHQKQHTVF